MSKLNFSLDKAPLPPQQYKIEELEPKINCYCCNDSGKIRNHLVRMAIPNFDPIKDKQPICQRLQCGLGLKFQSLIELGVLDTRFSHDMCEELHQIALVENKNTLDNGGNKIINIQAIANKKKIKNYEAEQTLSDAIIWEKAGK